LSSVAILSTASRRHGVDVTIKLYSFPLSGHAHRVRLLLSLLGLEFETIVAMPSTPVGLAG
jgi:hypothetical protein